MQNSPLLKPFTCNEAETLKDCPTLEASAPSFSPKTSATSPSLNDLLKELGLNCSNALRSFENNLETDILHTDAEFKRAEMVLQQISGLFEEQRTSPKGLLKFQSITSKKQKFAKDLQLQTNDGLNLKACIDAIFRFFEAASTHFEPRLSSLHTVEQIFWQLESQIDVCQDFERNACFAIQSKLVDSYCRLSLEDALRFVADINGQSDEQLNFRCQKSGQIIQASLRNRKKLKLAMELLEPFCSDAVILCLAHANLFNASKAKFYYKVACSNNSNNDSDINNTNILQSVFQNLSEFQSYLNCLLKSNDLGEAVALVHSQIQVDLHSKFKQDFFPASIVSQTVKKQDSQNKTGTDQQTQSGVGLDSHTFSIVIRPLARQSQESFSEALILLKRMPELDLEPDTKTIQALLTSKFCPDKPSILGLPETSTTAAAAFKQAKTGADLDRCFQIFKQMSFKNSHAGEQQTTSSTMAHSGISPATQYQGQSSADLQEQPMNFSISLSPIDSDSLLHSTPTLHTNPGQPHQHQQQLIYQMKKVTPKQGVNSSCANACQPSIKKDFLLNLLIDACIRCRQVHRAIQFVESILSNSSQQQSPTTTTQTSNQIIIPDEVTFNTLLKGCAAEKLPLKAEELYQQMVDYNLKPNQVTFNTLIEVYVQCDQIDKAWSILTIMRSQTVNKSVKPDNFTLSSLIKGVKPHRDYWNQNGQQASCKADPRVARAIMLVQEMHSHPWAFGDKPDEILYNCLLDMCVRFKDTRTAMEIFDQMRGFKVKPSSITYGILIKAFGLIGKVDKAFVLLQQMHEKGLVANSVTYGCLLDTCVKNKNLRRAEEVLELMRSNAIAMNTVIYTTMIKGYSKEWKLDKAYQLYLQMLTESEQDPTVAPNTITYNVLLDCCVRCFDMPLASQIFKQMLAQSKVSSSTNQKSSTRPDLITYSTMIKGYCKYRNLEEALFTLQLLETEQPEIRADEVLYNSLLDGCCKANDMEMAFKVYQNMRSLNIQPSNVTYSILVKIYSKQRNLTEALDLLAEMKRGGVKPGLVVYTCLIQTCLRAKNAVDKAEELFAEMRMSGVQPDTVTYSTFIKGLLQHRKYDQALNVCNEMLQQWQYQNKNKMAGQQKINFYSPQRGQSRADPLYEVLRKFEQALESENSSLAWQRAQQTQMAIHQLREMISQTTPFSSQAASFEPFQVITNQRYKTGAVQTMNPNKEAFNQKAFSDNQ